jgi:putative endonuclease
MPRNALSDAHCGRDDRMPEWYLYMVRCRGGNLYTGIATDVERRLAEHRTGKGAKCLRGRGRLKLVYKQRIGSRGSALKIERLIKKWPKEKKERLVASGIGIEEMMRQMNP